MAESESGADKSEEPTSKRLEESRKKGQTVRSRELNTVVVTMVGIGTLIVYGADFGHAVGNDGNLIRCETHKIRVDNSSRYGERFGTTGVKQRQQVNSTSRVFSKVKSFSASYAGTDTGHKSFA